MKTVSVWSRRRSIFLPGSDPIWSEPESAPEPRTSAARAAQKSGGSATLLKMYNKQSINQTKQSKWLIKRGKFLYYNLQVLKT